MAKGLVLRYLQLPEMARQSSLDYRADYQRTAYGSFHVKTANFQKNSHLNLSDFAKTSSKWVF